MLQIYRLAPTDTPAFEALATIYATAIEPSEQKSVAALAAAFVQPLYRFIVAAEAGAIVGFSIVYLSQDADIWVLEYLAVAAAHEGKGVGGKVFAHSAAIAGPERIGLIEADAETGKIDGSAMRRRRLAFYARLGCRRLGDISYLLPLQANGTPPPMDLLVHAPDAISSVSVETARDWLTRLYVEVYGQPADDPRIDLMLARQSREIALKSIGSAPGSAV